jgi:hypothetical protein
MPRHLTLIVAVGCFVAAVCDSHLFAQSTNSNGARHFPIDQHSPVGMAGEWAALRGKGLTSPLPFPEHQLAMERTSRAYFQPVRIELPCEGTVTFYSQPHEQPVTKAAPASAALLIGPVYRLGISGLAERPGADLYPTVELLDRLHPPSGMAADFPIPIPFTMEEIDRALDGAFVSKIIYLEDPRLTNLGLPDGSAPTEYLAPKLNLLEMADRRGRPVALVRLGGRVPDAANPEPGFFGSGAPVAFTAVTERLSTAKSPSVRQRPRANSPQVATQTRQLLKPR